MKTEDVDLRKIMAVSAVLMLVTAFLTSCAETGSADTTAVSVSVEMTEAAVTEMTETTTENETEPVTEADESNMVSVNIPDLSELGIKSDSFPNEGRKYVVEVGKNCDIGYKGERPKKISVICENDEMDILEFDSEGRLCRYDGAVIPIDELPEITRTDEEYREMAEKYMKMIEPDNKGYDPDTLDIDRENRRCTARFKRTYGEDIHDLIDIIFDGNGTVSQFRIFRSGADDTEAPARLREKVVEYGTDYCEKHYHNGSSVSDIVGECFELDGTIYGQYSYIANTGTAGSPIYTTFNVIVCDG